MAKKLKAIILDNEWVLVKNDWDKASEIASGAYCKSSLSGKDFKRALQLPCFPNGNKSNLLAEYSAGRIEGNLLWDRFLQSFNVLPSEENREAMREAFRNLTTDVDEDAVDFVKKLKEDGEYRLLLFSNTIPEIVQGNKERNSYYKLFNKLYFSYSIGFRKPETEAYRYILQDQKLRGRQCMFIDDKPENIEPAKKLGMQVLLHKIGEGKLSNKLGSLLKNEQ